GRVDGSARAGAHDEADLRHDARGLHVPPEDLGVAGERDDALLDPRAARVVDPDHRTAVLHGHVHDLADLLGEDLGEAPAEDGEVLREDEDLAPEDLAVARDDGVAPRPPLHHPEVRLAVADVAVELDEGARVAEALGALAGEELSLRALPLDRLRAPGVARLVAERLHALELALRRLGTRALFVCRRHRWSVPRRRFGRATAGLGSRSAASTRSRWQRARSGCR